MRIKSLTEIASEHTRTDAETLERAEVIAEQLFGDYPFLAANLAAFGLVYQDDNDIRVKWHIPGDDPDLTVITLAMKKKAKAI